jgi:hypothetical protein
MAKKTAWRKAASAAAIMARGGGGEKSANNSAALNGENQKGETSKISAKKSVSAKKKMANGEMGQK